MPSELTQGETKGQASIALVNQSLDGSHPEKDCDPWAVSLFSRGCSQVGGCLKAVCSRDRIPSFRGALSSTPLRPAHPSRSSRPGKATYILPPLPPTPKAASWELPLGPQVGEAEGASITDGWKLVDKYPQVSRHLNGRTPAIFHLLRGFPRRMGFSYWQWQFNQKHVLAGCLPLPSSSSFSCFLGSAQ